MNLWKTHRSHYFTNKTSLNVWITQANLMHVMALRAKNGSSSQQSISQWEQIIQFYFEQLNSALWQWSYTGGWQTVLAWRWMNQSSERCRIKRTTCVMAMVVGSGGPLLLCLAALVPGLWGGAPVGFRQQRGNGLPQWPSLGRASTVTLFLALRRSFLGVPVLRQVSRWRRTGNKDLLFSLWWMLSVQVKLLHVCLTTNLRAKSRNYTPKKLN